MRGLFGGANAQDDRPPRALSTAVSVAESRAEGPDRMVSRPMELGERHSTGRL